MSRYANTYCLKSKQLFLLSISILIFHGSGCKSTRRASIRSQDQNRLEQSTGMDIYLLIGQSNMAGRAEIELQDQDSLNGVFLFKGTNGNEWERAVNPLNKYSSIRKKLSMQKLGPGYAFAHAMARSTTKQIGLVVNAKGGTSIDLWMPGSDFYYEAVQRTKMAMTYGSLKGILWLQGESDASNYQLYMPKLLDMIRSFRSDFGLPELPFIASQLSGDKPHRDGFNTMILTLPAEIEHAAVIKSKRTSTIDSTHFDSQSQRLLGKRYAKKMKKLRK